MKVYIDEVRNEDGEVKGKLYLESDGMSFQLKEYNGKFDDKGNEQSKTLGYFMTIQQAVRYLLKMKLMESTSTTLGELLREVERIEAYIQSKVSV